MRYMAMVECQINSLNFVAFEEIVYKKEEAELMDLGVELDDSGSDGN